MERRWLMLFAGSLVGVALGLAIIEGIPERQEGFVSDMQDVSRLDEHDLRLSPKSERSESQPIDSVIGIPIGSEAPDFTLSDPNGRSIRLYDYRGWVVMVNFWATWCGPCRVEMPAFQNYHEQFQEQGFIVLGVNFDELEEDVRDFQEELGLTFPLLLDPGAEVQRLYKIRGYPSSVFINREGIIEYLHVGILTESQLNFYLEALGIQL